MLINPFITKTIKMVIKMTKDIENKINELYNSEIIDCDKIEELLRYLKTSNTTRCVGKYKIVLYEKMKFIQIIINDENDYVEFIDFCPLYINLDENGQLHSIEIDDIEFVEELFNDLTEEDIEILIKLANIIINCSESLNHFFGV